MVSLKSLYLFVYWPRNSEVALAVDVAKALELQGKTVRVVSVPSFELFNQQPSSYQSALLDDADLRVSIEAQSTFGWHQYIGRDGIAIGVDQFGLSAPLSDLKEEFGFNQDAVLAQIQAALDA